MAMAFAALAFVSLGFANAGWTCVWWVIYLVSVLLAMGVAAGTGGRNRAFAVGFMLGACWSTEMEESIARYLVDLSCEPLLGLFGHETSFSIRGFSYSSERFWHLYSVEYAAATYHVLAGLVIANLAGLLAAWFHDRYDAGRSIAASTGS
ncbi:MAG: hypothetical protein K1X74_01600 [Pirellulales bacterium]|nr:hypothetical protein [Pirellulales bacterium]